MKPSRTTVTMRTAEPADAAALAELWSASLRRADQHDQQRDLEQIIATAADASEQRLVVADYDGELAGAVLLSVVTLSALNLEPSVQVLAPTVFARFRRRGIGWLLMDSAVSFAEEAGVALVASAATSGSRDANRFLARLGLGPHATLRVAPAATIRARLSAQRPTLVPRAAGPAGAPGTRQASRVLAARRSLRRSQATG